MRPTIGDVGVFYRGPLSAFLHVATALITNPTLGADAVQHAFVRAIMHRSRSSDTWD